MLDEGSTGGIEIYFCVECGREIKEDENPYCETCYEDLARDGFFDSNDYD